MKTLYVGPLRSGTTSAQRLRAMCELGHEVKAIESEARLQSGLLLRTYDRILGKLFRLGLGAVRAPDRLRLNRVIIEAGTDSAWDVLWLDKALVVTPATLHRFRLLSPGAVVAGYSPDDMGSRHSHSRQFLEALPHYDVYFTTKSYGVPELKALGCPRVEFVENAYDTHVHRPLTVTDAERGFLGAPVGFIGTGEMERARSCACLAAAGIPMKVWGDRWLEFQRKTGGKFTVAGPSRYGDGYVKTVCAFDINLCFLRKMNRDFQTQRSVEIPACGAFMLAERTREHLGLFEEGKEAEFFSSNEELLRKVRYYLEHPVERMAVAKAGRERCLAGGYSYHERLKTMLDRVETIGQTNHLKRCSNSSPDAT